MLPITTGVIPFGLIMGTVAAASQIDFAQSGLMNILVFAGAAQLAAVDLMVSGAGIVVVVATALTINLRMLLYSAALSDLVKKSSLWIKLLVAYTVTDQTYSVLVANQRHLRNRQEKIHFYLGSALCMVLAWHAGVTLGFFFGNIAPASLSLDFAVPLSFVSLVLPTVKNRNYVLVVVTSSVLAVVFKPLPYNLGLILTAAISIGLATFLTRKKVS